MNNFGQAWRQLVFLGSEIKLIVNRKWWRWLTCWWGGSTGVIIAYRLDRAGYLLFRSGWPILRLFYLPLYFILRFISFPHELHYRADIGRGLKILHPALGVVVSARATVGEQLTLTGGNCIGIRGETDDGAFVIGDRATLGANAVILGPVKLGNNIQIGAGAVVVHDYPDGNVVLVGVPARPVTERDKASG